MTFAHDEIADFRGNIRLDYGYALTITSAQGATVDHAFLLADDKPARETIYPAVTRHREGLDVYVDREPLAMDVAARRPEDRMDERVTDGEVREYLAQRWSREQPKVAVVDHMSDELRARMRAEREAARDGRLSDREPEDGRGGASGKTGRNARSAGSSGTAPDSGCVGNYWQAGSVAGERGQSLYVHLAGGRRGKWTDAATGEKGDLLDLIRAASGHARMVDAMDEARAFLGGNPAAAREVGSAERPRADARRLQQFLHSGRGVGTETPAARYLRRRGLSSADAQDLRFHPGAWVQVDGETRALPALLAPVRTPDGTLEAVHRIFLAPDGRLAEIEGRKRNMGMPGRGAVWFGDPRTAKRVALCEGIEDAMAVLRDPGRAPGAGGGGDPVGRKNRRRRNSSAGPRGGSGSGPRRGGRTGVGSAAGAVRRVGGPGFAGVAERQGRERRPARGRTRCGRRSAR